MCPRAVTQSTNPYPTVPNGRLAEQRSLKSSDWVALPDRTLAVRGADAAALQENTAKCNAAAHWRNPPLNQPAILGALHWAQLERGQSPKHPAQAPNNRPCAGPVSVGGGEVATGGLTVAQWKDLKPAEPCPRATRDRTKGIPHRPRPGRRDGPSPGRWEALGRVPSPGPLRLLQAGSARASVEDPAAALLSQLSAAPEFRPWTSSRASPASASSAHVLRRKRAFTVFSF